MTCSVAATILAYIDTHFCNPLALSFFQLAISSATASTSSGRQHNTITWLKKWSCVWCIPFLAGADASPPLPPAPMKVNDHYYVTMSLAFIATFVCCNWLAALILAPAVICAAIVSLTYSLLFMQLIIATQLSLTFSRQAADHNKEGKPGSARQYGEAAFVCDAIGFTVMVVMFFLELTAVLALVVFLLTGTITIEDLNIFNNQLYRDYSHAILVLRFVDVVAFNEHHCINCSSYT